MPEIEIIGALRDPKATDAFINAVEAWDDRYDTAENAMITGLVRQLRPSVRQFKELGRHEVTAQQRLVGTFELTVHRFQEAPANFEAARSFFSLFAEKPEEDSSTYSSFEKM